MMNDSIDLSASGQDLAGKAAISHHEEVVSPIGVVFMDRISTWRYVMIMSSFSMALVLSLMDISIVSTATFTIAQEYGALANVTWIILAYTLTYLGFGVVVTRFADVVGRQYALIACYVIFIAMSFGCGFSTSLNMLIAFRAVQGIGGSGMYSLCLVVLPEISPTKMLPFVSALMGLLVGVAAILGPLLGGIISQHNWRWIFFLNGPVGIAALIVLIIAWPRNAHGWDLGKQRLRDIDFVGCLLLLAACILVVFGLQQGGVGTYDWSSPVIICTLLFGCLAAVVLFCWELFICKAYPKVAMILPATVFRKRVMLAGIVSALCSGFSLFICTFYIPLRFQIVNLDTPLQAGVRLIPFLGGTAFGTLLAGSVNARRNFIFHTCIIAFGLIITGNVLLSTLPWGFDVTGIAYGYQVISGVGIGMTLASVTLLVPLVSDFKDYAVTQGIVGQARVLGGSIGIAAASAIFNTQLRAQLSDLLTVEQIRDLQSSYGATVATLNASQLLAIRNVYASSFAETLRLCSYIAAVGLVAALFTWQRRPINVSQRKQEIDAARDALIRERRQEDGM